MSGSADQSALADIDTSMFEPSSYLRQSRLPLELDVAAWHILNPRLLAPRSIHNTLTIPAPAPPPEPLVLSVRELWEDERKRRIAKNLPATPVMPSDGTGARGAGPGWRAEPRLRAELQARIERERDNRPSYAPLSQPWEKFIMTAFESREYLWPQDYRSWKPEADSEGSTYNTPEGGDSRTSPRKRGTLDDLDVDETFMRSQRINDILLAADRDDEAIDNAEPGEAPESVSYPPHEVLLITITVPNHLQSKLLGRSKPPQRDRCKCAPTLISTYSTPPPSSTTATPVKKSLYNRRSVSRLSSPSGSVDDRPDSPTPIRKRKNPFGSDLTDTNGFEQASPTKRRNTGTSTPLRRTG